MKDLLFQDKLLFRWAITAKPPGNWLKNRRLCLSALTILLATGHRRAVEPEENTKKETRSDPAIIHPRFAAWYKLGNTL